MSELNQFFKQSFESDNNNSYLIAPTRQRDMLAFIK